ncbi:hypothetical protein O0L34_g5239 [Tuta absoluta]|nr:hypothetical protein O0L34_g5239 [Tuta absoluta]
MPAKFNTPSLTPALLSRTFSQINGLFFQSAICVEVTGGTDRPFTITFKPFTTGDAPVRVDNLCEDLFLKLHQQDSGQVALLSPYQSMLYTWDDPSKDRKLLWNIYNNKGKGFMADFNQDGFGEEKVSFHSVKHSTLVATSSVTSKLSSTLKRLTPKSPEPCTSSSDDSDSTDVREHPKSKDKSKKMRKDKVIVYWISYMDGYQRVFALAQDEKIAYQYKMRINSERSNYEIYASLSGVSLSVCVQTHVGIKELAYASITDSMPKWEVNVSHKWKQLSPDLTAWIEDKYQKDETKCNLKEYIHIDLEKMQMTKPFFSELRRTYNPGVWLQLRKSDTFTYCHLKFQRLQLDNQLNEAVFPSVLYPAPLPQNLRNNREIKPCLEIVALKQYRPTLNQDVYKYFKVLIQEFCVNLDRGFVNYVFDILNHWKIEEKPAVRLRADLALVHMPLPILALKSQMVAKRNVLMEYVHLSPIKVVLSLSSRGYSAESTNSPGRTRFGNKKENRPKLFNSDLLEYLFNSWGSSLCDMKDVVIRMAYLELRNAPITSSTLIDLASRHYWTQLVQQFYVLVLGLNILGNPYSVIGDFSKGFRQYYEPYLIMVRAYKRKTNRGGWDENRMRQAIKDVLEGKRGYKLASKFYEVPQTTLERKVKLARENENQIQNVKVPLGPIATVFTKDEEQELVVYLKEMEARLFGLTTTELQKLAYQLAVRNNKQHKFNNEDEMAGKVWLKGFLNRHPELSLRKPENTSAARAAGFNRVSVAQFFELLAQAYDKHGFTPDRIYNCDETGISVVPKTRSKVIAATGKKQVGALTSAERGTTITVEICFNAAGTYMPPMFIYPRKRMKKELLYGAPPNAWAECSDSGWITTEIFFMWFQKFLKFSNASTDNPVMLLLDGHASHTQNVQLIDEARKHGVTIICFPPHTTHKLQPGDVGFMRPLSVFYDQAVTAWLRSNPGHVVTQFQVAKLFGEAFIRSATMATAINAFKACGISPYNPQIFTDADFVAAEATDIELNVEEQPDAPNHTTEAIQQEPLMAQNSAITNSELPLHQNEANQRIAGASQTIEGALMLPCSSVTYNSRELNTEKQPPSASKSTESLPQQPISIQNAGTQSAPSASLPNKASQSTLSPSKPSTILQPTAEAASNSTVTPPIETSAKEGQLQSETPAPIAGTFSSRKPDDIAYKLGYGAARLLGQCACGAARAAAMFDDVPKPLPAKRRGEEGVQSNDLPDSVIQADTHHASSVALALTGLIARPTIDVCREAARAAMAQQMGADSAESALKACVERSGGRLVARKRLPRHCPATEGIRPYSQHAALGLQLLTLLGRGHYADTDAYIAHAHLGSANNSILLVTTQHIFMVRGGSNSWHAEWAVRLDDLVAVPTIRDDTLVLVVKQDELVNYFATDEKVIEVPCAEVRAWLQAKIEGALILALEDKRVPDEP